MSKKDPAVLLYFDKWISSTNGMKAEFRAWYLDLMIHQYDKGKIPSDLDELAGICRVRPSEYEIFNQMVVQVLNQKFTLTDGFYYNEVVNDVLRKREAFIEKRTISSNIGVVIKIARSIKTVTEAHIDFIKEFLKDKSIEEINTYKSNHMVNHLVNLYINEDVNKDVISDLDGLLLDPKTLTVIDPEFYDRENDFLSDFNRVRKFYDKIETNLEAMVYKEKTSFKEIKQKFPIPTIRDALVGMYEQQGMYKYNRIRPAHFLENVELYLECGKNGIKLFEQQRPKTDKL